MEASLTAYDRTTRDLMIARSSAFGGGLLLNDAGRVSNLGAEGRVRVHGTAVRRAEWEVEALGARDRNRYTARVGEVPLSVGARQFVRDGQPLGVVYGTRLLGYEDRNGHGIIGAAGCPGPTCEVTVGTTAEPQGSLDPTRMPALSAMPVVRF